MSRSRSIAGLLLPLALVVSACGTAASSPPVTFGPPSAAPPTEPAPSGAASPAPTGPPAASPPQAGGATVNAAEVGSRGTILVAGSNGMTLYIFTQDVKDSGTSACTGGCLATWPALTVAAGETPTGGDGVTGTVGTITRPDDGSLQVTYNGLPLYFFVRDSAPGDAIGVYTSWEVVAP
jgi:predicted lipoprotein with Yx(FWY)xxD motif